ncbi:DNA-binding IclR family transcriptional regulator [Nocardioides aromaticivorans]|uniref:DNA-binding IclR family transcriptional regulator n=1 Tax=Nocardioides aromaticivorans TaxID=200618 RepID=A0A7Y9ZIK0_9ACTN|nr:IclR family transcriptional regulator [Nocardioides aromaticivorans]NYI45048.1 DNA-binding IclR family transcriptional regulator [Nocardioides aromaticivorans]
MRARPLDVSVPTLEHSTPDGGSVGKAISLLTAFGDAAGGATLTELAHIAGVPKSTAHRLLGVLRDAGLVDRDGMDWYLCAPMLRLGAVALRGGAGVLREVALPYLSELYELTHENVHLGVLDGTDVVYLDKIYGHRSTSTPSRVGSRLNAHTSGLGKAILSRSDRTAVKRVLDGGLRPTTTRSIALPGMFLRQLEAARQEGVAFDREECREGLVCVAAPILGPSGRAVAAISVAGSARTLKIDAIASAVRNAAVQVSRKAGPDVDLIATGT